MRLRRQDLIHPNQIAVANEIFAPGRRRNRARARDRGGFRAARECEPGRDRIDGRMVERLHADMARRVVALAAAIEAAHAGPGQSVQGPRLFGQHDRDAVADRIGELRAAADQFLAAGIVIERVPSSAGRRAFRAASGRSGSPRRAGSRCGIGCSSSRSLLQRRVRAAAARAPARSP